MSDELEVLRLEDRIIHLASRQVRCACGVTPLTKIEVGLLRYLAEHAPEPVTRDELLERVWGYRPGVQTRAVDYAVRRLRQKLEQEPTQPRVIRSVYGVGYCLDVGAS